MEMAAAGAGIARVARETVVDELIEEDGYLHRGRSRNMPVTTRVLDVLAHSYGATYRAWGSYRLGYGLQFEDKADITNPNRPFRLQWATKALSAEYNPTLQELFADVERVPMVRADGKTRVGQYYIVLSRLDVRQWRRLSADPRQYASVVKAQIEDQLYRLQELYVRMPPPTQEGGLWVDPSAEGGSRAAGGGEGGRRSGAQARLTWESEAESSAALVQMRGLLAEMRGD